MGHLQSEDIELNAAVTLTPLPGIEAKYVQPGKLYIWSLPHGERTVVWLNEEGDGLAVYYCLGTNNEAHWYFENDRVGKLYGPIELDDEPTEEDE